MDEDVVETNKGWPSSNKSIVRMQGLARFRKPPKRSVPLMGLVLNGGGHSLSRASSLTTQRIDARVKTLAGTSS
jgi:hypothetical protein